MGSCNDPPPLCSRNDPHIHDQMPNISGDDIVTCEDVTITSHKMLKSTLATPKEVKKGERDVKAAKEKLQAMERHDKFELMSKDKDGKAMFQIWCVECESSYGQGGHDTIFNFTHSHINSMAHQRHIGVCKKRKQEHDNEKAECSKEDLISTNKEKVDEAFLEVSSFDRDNNAIFSVVTDTLGEFENLSKMFLECSLDKKWIPLFAKSGSLRQCIIEHLKSKLHIKATNGDLDEKISKVGCPSKASIEDKRQRNLHGFFKPNVNLGERTLFFSYMQED
ncbi:hypothetical protein L7F22_032459 [Adiantum nelumboides]|nr:hypothetical protein [Adiantum nelumboides]